VPKPVHLIQEYDPIARKPPADAGKTTRSAGTDGKRRAAQGAPVPGLAEAAKAPGTPRKKAAVAGPRRVRRDAAEPDMLDKYVSVIVASLEDDKAEDIVVLDLVGRAAFADRMVVATGLADRQISAMATHLEEKLEEAGLKRVLIEGAGQSDWVLIDAGDVVVHLFKPDARALYALEKMWGRELDEPPAPAG
jgi:nicotinate-nucleotide adenylyltransferase